MSGKLATSLLKEWIVGCIDDKILYSFNLKLFFKWIIIKGQTNVKKHIKWKK